MSGHWIALSDQEAQFCACLFGLQVWWFAGKWIVPLVSLRRRNTGVAP